MVLGSGISCAEAVFESLCRTCSRILIGGWGRDPGASVQKQEALVRLKRREMLSLLERELDSGWPEGVFDLNVSESTLCLSDGETHTSSYDSIS